jgi:putative membrane protein
VLRGFFGRDRAERKDSIRYLIKFFIGWAIGMGTAVLILSQIFDKNIYFLSSMFLGLTIASIPFILYEERDTIKGKYWCVVFTVIGILLVTSLSFLRGNGGGMGAIDYLHQSFWQYGYLFLSGICAISAMLLPGISGSTLLLILGVYVPTIQAVKECMQMHLQYVPGLLCLGVGIIFGAAFAPRIIKAGLEAFRPQMVYLILGLMIGSLYAICTGPTTLKIPQDAVSLSSFKIPAFIIGIAVLVGLEWLRRYSEKQEAAVQ